MRKTKQVTYAVAAENDRNSQASTEKSGELVGGKYSFTNFASKLSDDKNRRIRVNNLSNKPNGGGAGQEFKMNLGDDAQQAQKKKRSYRKKDDIFD